MKWTPEELARLQHFYPDMLTKTLAEAMGKTRSQIFNMAYKFGIRKSERFMQSPLSGRTSHCNKGGRFRKGMIPWNKGKHHAPEGSRKNYFKPGHMPQTWRPIGSERIDKDGILWRKVADTRHKPTDWKRVHVIVWEEHNGQVPEGWLVVFKNGNKTDIRIDNLECISRAENMERNTYLRYPPELRSVIMQRGALNRKINERSMS